MSWFETIQKIPIDDNYSLELLETHDHTFIEQKHVRYFLKDNKTDTFSISAVIEGLISLGRKEITPGWIDIDIFPKVTINSNKIELDFQQLINIMEFLGKFLPQGGHIMFSYSMITGETELHKETWISLQKGIPEALSPIGELLVHAGAVSFKNWYFAEGALEGNIKLQGNIPLNINDAKDKIRALIQEIEIFIDENRERKERHIVKALERFERIRLILIDKLQDPSNLSQF